MIRRRNVREGISTKSLLQTAIHFLPLSFVSAILFVGCSGVHLHNSADELLAKKAQDSFKAADVSGFIDTERKTLALYNQRELAATKRSIQAQRDGIILYALENDTTVRAFTDDLKSRLSSLGIPLSEADRKNLYDLDDFRDEALRLRSAYALHALGKGLPYPSFPPSANDTLEADKVWTRPSLFSEYEDAAKIYSEARKKVAAYGQGELGALQKRLQDASDLQDQIIVKAKLAKAALEGATNEYKKAVVNPESTLDDAQKEVESALEKFDAVTTEYQGVAKTLNLDDILAIAQVEKLKIIRTTIGEFLSTYSKDDGSETSANKRTLSDTAGRTAAVLVKAKKEIRNASVHSKVVPLVFEQERLRIEIENGERAIARGKRRIAILERQKAELIQEGIKLADSFSSITEACKAIPCEDGSANILALLGNSKSNDSALHSLFVLSESISINKLKRREGAVEVIGLDHEEAVDASEYALNLWKHMIASPLEELVAYHASGLKSQDIANLIHAAGLAGIAVGVNR